MLAVAQHHGLDLPVYGPEVPIIYGSLHGRELPMYTKETFVREVILIAPGIDSLKRALKAANELFDRAAEDCGGLVIKHEWGLAPRRPDTHARPGRLIPGGYELVAEVDFIYDAAEPTPKQKRMINKNKQRQGRWPRGTLRWSDQDEDQFSNGCTEAIQQSGLILHDIEPILTRC